MNEFVEIPATDRIMERRKARHGIAVNDMPYRVDANGVTCPYFSKWSAMINRCYSLRSIKFRPSYLYCYVCSDWLLFSNFRKWMKTQDWKGKFLDKDLLIQGNLVYSPDTCIFVSRAINNIWVKPKNINNKYLLGVAWNKTAKKFRAACCVNGEPVHIGLFDNELDAHKAYRNFKYTYVKAVSETQPEPIRSALLRWDMDK